MTPSDRDRKHEWKAAQRRAAAAAFPLPDEALRDLFDAVDARLADDPCDHTLRFTEAFIGQRAEDRAAVVSWLHDNGGYCDCEVVANVADHWRQSR